MNVRHYVARVTDALAWLLLAESCLVLAQGMTMAEYVASRDPVSGTAYLLSLALFAAMPLLVGARPRSNRP